MRQELILCTTCLEQKLPSEFYVDKRRNIPIRKCKKCVYEHTKQWRLDNAQKTRDIKKNWYNKNIVRERARIRIWRKNNPDKAAKSRKRGSEKYLSTARGCLCNRMRARLRRAIGDKKNGREWESLVGYSASDLCKHLESLFVDGMTWEKLLSGEIHIDHKIPVTFFKFQSTNDVEFKMCWRLENLQPLWAKDNHIKSNKIMKVAV